MATLQLLTGYEQGVISIAGEGLFLVIDGSGMSIDSTNQRTGSYCLKGLGTSGETDVLWDLPTTPTEFSLSFYFKWHTLPNVVVSIARIYVNTGSTARINFDPSDQKIFGRYVSDGTKVNQVLAQDTWYRIEAKGSVADNPSTLTYKVNEVTEQTTTYAQSATVYDGVLLGLIESTPTISAGEVYFDDVIVTFEYDDYPLGAHAVAGLSPSSTAGTSSPGAVIKDTSATLIDDSTNPPYVELDEVPLTSTSDYIQQDGTGDYYAEVNFADMPAGGTPLGVRAYMGYTSSSTTANNGEFRVRNSLGEETSIYDSDMSDTSLSYKSGMVTAPTGGGWTEAHVNALKGRVGYSTSVASVPRWQSLMLEVAYQESGGTTLEVNISPEAGTSRQTGVRIYTP